MEKYESEKLNKCKENEREILGKKEVIITCRWYDFKKNRNPKDHW